MRSGGWLDDVLRRRRAGCWLASGLHDGAFGCLGGGLVGVDRVRGAAMKIQIDVTPEEKRLLLRWALKTDHVDMWNDRGVFKSNIAAAHVFRLGLDLITRNDK